MFKTFNIVSFTLLECSHLNYVRMQPFKSLLSEPLHSGQKKKLFSLLILIKPVLTFI